ncbi:MAG: RagB/SusD family nutrient uptake outer membrane protein [Tannerella sp.]|nr:RagB/SusD family nutrient uptake outer membrane protein [Tannerella sp.]
MKTRIVIIVTGLAGWFLTSCSDLLDLNPLDKISSATFWKSETDFDNALAACYGSMQSDYFSYGYPYWDNLSDNGYGQHNYGSSTDIASGNITTNTGGFVSGIYNQSYRAIARINSFLLNLEGYSGISAEKKTQSVAEARMLRAFFYSYLYRCYGDVPVVETPLDLDNHIQPKNPAAEVLSFLMSDLDFAISNLKDATYSESKGRWTANSAKAYKARILLYDAYDSNGKAIISQMNAAKDLLSGVSGYKLADEFSDNFYDLQQESCPEIIFSVKFLAPNNRTSADQWYADWMVVSPTANLISEYDMADGTPGTPVPTSGGGAVDPAVFSNASLDEREPRAAKTFFINEYRIGGGAYIPSNNRPLGTGLSKFLSPNLTPPFGYSTYSQQDWIVLRYADILLMQAEVENEINGPTAIAYNAINDIRKRGGTSLLPEGLTQDQMRERIRHERRIELAFEGQRYFDLKRWKIAKEVLNNVKDGLITYKFEDKHYLWPLPQTEIDKANGVLEQNPNYK